MGDGACTRRPEKRLRDGAGLRSGPCTKRGAGRAAAHALIPTPPLVPAPGAHPTTPGTTPNARA